jgi:hypothetical protein
MDLPYGKEKHIDQAKVAAKKALAERLELLYETGDEQAFVELVKAANPSVTPEKLVELIEAFRERRRSYARGSSKRP